MFRVIRTHSNAFYTDGAKLSSRGFEPGGPDEGALFESIPALMDTLKEFKTVTSSRLGTGLYVVNAFKPASKRQETWALGLSVWVQKV